MFQNVNNSQGGRGHWTVNYMANLSFMNTVTLWLENLKPSVPKLIISIYRMGNFVYNNWECT